MAGKGSPALHGCWVHVDVHVESEQVPMQVAHGRVTLAGWSFSHGPQWSSLLGGRVVSLVVSRWGPVALHEGGELQKMPMNSVMERSCGEEWLWLSSPS